MGKGVTCPFRPAKRSDSLPKNKAIGSTGADNRGDDQMGAFFKSLILGFAAGAIAFVTVHEAVALWLLNHGHSTYVPWSMDISSFTGQPQLVSGALWGGLWGALFAIILGSVPEGSMTVRGAVLGLVGPAVIGTLVALPLINGQQPLSGVTVEALWPLLLVSAAFGAATAWLYGFFSSGFRLP